MYSFRCYEDLPTCGHALSTPYSNNERDHQAVPKQSFRPVCIQGMTQADQSILPAPVIRLFQTKRYLLFGLLRDARCWK